MRLFHWIHSFAGFILFSFISTVGASLVDPTYRVLITQYTPQEMKKLVFNIRYYLINIAAAIGPLLAAQLLFLGMARLFYAVSITFTINLLLFVILFRRFQLSPVASSEEKIPFFNVLYIFKKNRTFLFLVLGDIFIVFGYTQMSTTLSQYFGHIFDYQAAVKNYAFLLLVNAVTVLTCQYFIFRIGNIIKTSIAMMIGAFLLPTGLLFFGLSSNIVILAVAMFIFTIGEMLLFTMWDIRIDEISEPHLKGSYYSLTGLVGISRIIAPLIGDLLLDTVENGLLLFSILAAISYCAIYFFRASGDMKSIS
ncbi:MFS transporter [Macrococcus brunensis]|uniref:MFS transporter n=1 Tax=Macrococcus brunensis TaxID=198483 RepID=UPI001EF06787|nr:MFS transporter [Macrococcus brunensis]ULG74487.1 MFS transporter [Macrococcus brunensis]